MTNKSTAKELFREQKRHKQTQKELELSNKKISRLVNEVNSLRDLIAK